MSKKQTKGEKKTPAPVVKKTTAAPAPVAAPQATAPATPAPVAQAGNQPAPQANANQAPQQGQQTQQGQQPPKPFNPLQDRAIHNPNPAAGPIPSTAPGRVLFEEIPTQTAVDGIRFDFSFGYRIVVPKNTPQESYRFRMIDMDSGCVLETFELKRGERRVGAKKFYIPYRIEIYIGEQLAFAHNYNCEGKRVYIMIPHGGMGDGLAWLPLADCFREKTKANVCCVVGEWIINLVGDLYPGLDFLPVDNPPRLTHAYACYFCGIYNGEKKDWRPIEHQQLGMQGSVEASLGLPIEPVKCRLHLGSKRPFPEPYVCISTMGTSPEKNWNFPDGWNQIIRMLKSYGYRVMDIDRVHTINYRVFHQAIPSEAEDFTGALPLQERIALLEHADFFIGLPSGLSWLAWNTNIPIVMIAGFTMPSCEFPTPYRVTNYLYCHGCWNDSTCFFDPKVPVWCPRHLGTPREIECTRVITPKMVRDVIWQIPIFQQRVREASLRRDIQAMHVQQAPRQATPVAPAQPAAPAENKGERK